MSRSNPIYNASSVTRAAKSDYAVNGGDEKVDAGPGGPRSMKERDLKAYDWPSAKEINGISFIRSKIRMRHVKDGTSKTYLVGEKYVSADAYESGGSGDDQGMYIGDDADIRRWAMRPPLRDSWGVRAKDEFGSAHVGGCQFVMCDGSVRVIGFDVAPDVHSSLANRRDSK